GQPRDWKSDHNFRPCDVRGPPEGRPPRARGVVTIDTSARGRYPAAARSSLPPSGARPARAMDHKNIVICSDGTGNTTIKGRGTNVFKLFEAVDVNGHLANPALTRQLAFYDDGIGTQELRWIRAFAGATGYGLSRN